MPTFIAKIDHAADPTEVDNGLPKGWHWVSLEDIVENPKSDIVDGPFGSDLKASEYKEEGVPIIRIQNVDRNKFNERNVRFVSHQKARELKRHSFQPGDIVITKLGDPVGKACIVPDNFGPGIIVADIVRLRLNPSSYSIPYMAYSINSSKAAEQIAEHVKGTTRPRVNLNHMRELRIPLPPLPEQKRIVAKIEELLPKVNAVRERVLRVKEIMKRFRQSVLSAACSGRLTEDWRMTNNSAQDAISLVARIRDSFQRKGASHGGQAATPTEGIHELSREQIPESWDVAELKWLCSPGRPITYGILKPGPHQNDGVPYIRVADFPKNYLEQSAIRKTSRTIAAQYERSSLKGGDVLLSIRGTVGRVCRVPTSLEGSNITQDTARISVHSDLCPEYIEIYLKSPMAQKTLEKAKKGVAVRGVNIGDVRVLQVPVPSITEQKEIVRRMEALFKIADRIEKRVDVELSRTEEMTQAILAKAFRGEIVPKENQ